jgi:hypothetical protein
MRKFLTLLTALWVVISALSAQVAWNQIKVSTTKTPGADTAYFAITCRGTYAQSISSALSDSVKAIALPTGFSPGDSAVWYVVKGASYGTIQRVRIVNSRTGQYLYVGKKGGTSSVVYVGPRVDPYNGLKDLFLSDNGWLKGTVPYYGLEDLDHNRIGNWASGQLSIYPASSSKYANANNQWCFSSKKGPQPKVTGLKIPEITIFSNENVLYANGSTTLSVSLKKDTYDFSGQALVYHGNVLIDTLDLNKSGAGTFKYSVLALGTESFTVVYSGDEHYDPANATITLNVIQAVTALPTHLDVNLPIAAEVHHEVNLNLTVTDNQSVTVTQGSLLVYVNDILRNKLTLDSQGKASLVIPNLISGTHSIKTVYQGDGIKYLNSDTVRNTITVSPSSSTVIPYPVYFDLCNQPEIKTWNYKYPVMASNATTLSHAFPQDSLPGIKLEVDSAKVTYNSLALIYTNVDQKDYYNHADNIVLSLGSSRSKWVNFKTPWLNEGSYNVYLSQRLPNSSLILPINSVTLDNKELYWPEQELTGRWLNFQGTPNNTRRWNAKGHSGLLPLFYLGAVKVDKSDVHNLKITVADQAGSDAITLDILQFLPVDQDSVSVNNSAALNFAKTYYPLFDLGGFARSAGDGAYSNFVSYANMSTPYQVQDQTGYTKIPYTLTGLVQSDPNTYFGTDYVTIYKKDQWTRVAEGPILSDATFSTELEQGTYYYEVINYSPVVDILGTSGYRYLLQKGTFTVGDNTDVRKTTASDLQIAVANDKLLIKGIKENTSIRLTDVTGRIIINTTANSLSKEVSLPAKGVYILTTNSVSEGSHSIKILSH